MSLFSFPPESYSAVYDGKNEANGTVAVVEAVAESSPTSARSSSTSLFSCFHCAIPKQIKGLRKQKNEAKYKVKSTSDVESKCSHPHAPPRSQSIILYASL